MVKRGFTIVELLIVIVVIGILATVIIVSYVGISNQANNVAVQNDLEQSLKKAERWEVQNGSIPDSSDQTAASIFVASKVAYSNSGNGNSYLMCRSNDDIVFVARSNAEATFYAGKKIGSGSLSSWPSDSGNTTCPTVGISTSAPGFGFNWAHANNAWKI